MSMEEARMWRERYRLLFDCNVAGITLTNIEGRIVDCNETCAQMFGFDSRKDMLAYGAWDFYFHSADRHRLVEQLRTHRSCPAQELCLRGRNGPVWVLATITVASFANGVPELLQSTAVDITAQKKAQARDVKSGQSAQLPEGVTAEMSDLSRRIGNILRRVSKSLQPDNLSRIDRTEMQECFLALEQTKVLMAELELLQLLRE